MDISSSSRPLSVLLLLSIALPGCTGTSDHKRTLNGNCAYPASLEITSVNIGQGDAAIIATPTKIVLADVGESYWNSSIDARTLDDAIQSRYACSDIDHVIISHMQVDHIGYVNYGGLWYLTNVLDYQIGETLLRDYAANVGTTSGTYDNWVTYLASQDGITKLNPRTAVAGEVLDLGDGIALTITNVDTRTVGCPGGWGSDPDLLCGGEYVTPSEVLGDHRGESLVPSENDYSVGFVVSVGDFDMYIGGDTDGETADGGFGSKTHDVESYLAAEIGEIDVLRVNHHGSDHSTNDTFVALLDPQAAILSVGNANTYGHARQGAVDRLLGITAGEPTRATWMYMTERGDDGIGGCLTDYQYSGTAAANLYDQATVVSDTDGDYCTIEGGDADIVVATDGSTFTIEGDLFTSAADGSVGCNADGTCDPGEDCFNCAPDCPSGSAADCGNGVCEAGDGEDCVSCPADCAGTQGGKPSNRFCCGDGDGQNPAACSDSRCTTGGYQCSDQAAGSYCCGDNSCDTGEDSGTCSLDCGAGSYCGDATCDPGETSCSCAADCGAPPATELDCTDGADADCDGDTDCDDGDCSADPACAATCDGDGVCESGEDCHGCPGDCEGKTGGKPSTRFCCGDGTAQAPEGGGAICDGNF